MGTHTDTHTHTHKHTRVMCRCVVDPMFGQVLLQAVTVTMSQSGLANIERACDNTLVAVCGGDQIVRYTLQPSSPAVGSSAGDTASSDGSWMLAPNAWELELYI